MLSNPRWRVIIEDFYNCAPRGRYIERRGYHVRIEPDFNPTSTVIGVFQQRRPALV
jgi:hypothetical protein